MRDNIVDIRNFDKHGFMALEDTTAAPAGALRIMRNAQVTDRGNLAPRPGTILIGTKNNGDGVVRGFYNFRKSLSTDEVLIKCYGTKIEYMSKAYDTGEWTELKDSYTDGAEFGFATSLVNTANEDYVVGCNRFEPYFRWSGALAQLTAALVGGETTIPVDSTVLPDVYEQKLAIASSATTLDVAGTPWAADQWISFFVYIVDGPLAGKVREITDNDSNTITFDTLGGDPGACNFEIRRLKFPETGTIIYNGQSIAYSAIDTIDSLTVASAHAAPDESLVTLDITEYPGNPRGNRFTNYLGRIVVGNVRNAMARGSGGALQGYASAGAVFVSKLLDPFSFEYSATRVAGEGDLIPMPYGGGDITDVQHQEDTAYAFKGRYVEAFKYSQDENDLAIRDPLKQEIGAVGKTIKGADDIYFITPDKQLTSIGRVRQKDIRPQTLDIGNRVKRFLDVCGVDDLGRGAEIAEKMYIPLKSLDGIDQNDILLIWNRNSRIFEGVWDIGANFIEKWNEKWLYGSSTGPNAYQLFQGHADIEGDTRYPIDFEVASHFMNLTASKAYLQAMCGVVIEGYIAGGATFTHKMWADFATDPFLEFNFSFNEEAFLDGDASQAFLGQNPLSIDPMGMEISDIDATGRRHFSYRTYFPWQYHNYYAFGFASSEVDDDFEISRLGLIMKEDVSINTNRVKST